MIEGDPRGVVGVGIAELLVIVVVALLCALPALALLAMFVMTIVDTVRGQGRWGINTKPTACPQCHTPAPTFRTPKNVRQAMWGGWTCERCHIEIDKWGKPIRDR